LAILTHPQSEPGYYGLNDIEDIKGELENILVWSCRFYRDCHNHSIQGVYSVAAFDIVIRTLELITEALPNLDTGDPDSYFNRR